MVPITMRFDGADNVNGSDTVRLPKLCQGAPYSWGIRVRLEDDSYRVWDAVNIRWRIKLRPAAKHELLVLEKVDGNFTVNEDTDTLNFVIKASDWTAVVLPQSTNHLEMDVPFSFVVEFLDAQGTVTERFAHGSGFITVSLDF